MKWQRDILMRQLDGLMTNPLITAMAEVITSQANLTVAATAAMNRSITTAYAAVMEAAVTAVMESADASDE